MRVNVSGLLKAPTGTMRIAEVDADIDLDDNDVEAVEPVTGAVRLIRDHAGVLVTGRLSTRVQLACSRCLEPVVEDIAFDLEESFRPVLGIPGGPPAVARTEWEEATLIDEHNVLDLTEVVRQSVLLAVPLHPLCRSDCAGLCPRCGTNRNVSTCDCEPESDPRWDALRALLGDGEE